MVNAVVHRSYPMAGDHIRVSIFPHRIEVFSPGRFPGPGDPSRPLEIARYARNPRIARGAPNRARPQGPGPRRPAPTRGASRRGLLPIGIWPRGPPPP